MSGGAYLTRIFATFWNIGAHLSFVHTYFRFVQHPGTFLIVNEIKGHVMELGRHF
jgi:hypothetical protein